MHFLIAIKNGTIKYFKKKIACKAGYFGRECFSVCLEHCKVCRHTDGCCSCLTGYTGYRCNTGQLQFKKRKVTYMRHKYLRTS